MLGNGRRVCPSVAGRVGMADRARGRQSSRMLTGSGNMQVVDDLDMDWQRRRGQRLGVFRIARRRA